MYGCYHGHHHGAKGAILAMGIVSIVLTIPFIFYAKEIADSLHALAYKEE